MEDLPSQKHLPLISPMEINEAFVWGCHVFLFLPAFKMCKAGRKSTGIDSPPRRAPTEKAAPVVFLFAMQLRKSHTKEKGYANCPRINICQQNTRNRPAANLKRAEILPQPSPLFSSVYILNSSINHLKASDLVDEKSLIGSQLY